MVNSKRKGKSGELEVCHYWQPMFPDAHRHLETREREAKAGVDVILDDKHEIQVKIGNQVPKTAYKYMNQLKPVGGRIQWVQMRRDRKDWLVMMRADEFKKLIKKASS